MAETLYIVTYQFRGSRYFDSPLYRRVERQRFFSYEAAAAWADAEHPDLPEYKTLGIHAEKPVVTGRDIIGPSERARLSDRNSDACILAANRRF